MGRRRRRFDIGCSLDTIFGPTTARSKSAVPSPVVPAMIQQRANTFQRGTRRHVACAAAESSPSVFVFGLNGYTSLALGN